MKRIVFPIVFALTAVVSHPTSAGPSFNCHTRLTPTEWAICSNSDLAHMDARMSGLYGNLLDGITDRGVRIDVKREQVQWLRLRDTCGGNVACLREAYRHRNQELHAWLSGC